MFNATVKPVFSRIFLSLIAICCSLAAAAEPSTLRTISIDSNVWITTKPTIDPYKGDPKPETIQTLKNLADGSEINLRDIVLKRFRTRLQQGDLPIAIAAANANAELHIHIEDYGLTARNKTLLQPTITIEARLVKSNGHVIWNAGENLSDSELQGISAQTWEDYTAKPALLKSGYEEVANAAVNTIVDNLIDSHKAGEIGE